VDDSTPGGAQLFTLCVLSSILSTVFLKHVRIVTKKCWTPRHVETSNMCTRCFQIQVDARLEALIPSRTGLNGLTMSLWVSLGHDMSRLRFSADLQSPFQDESYEGKGPAAQITWRLAKMAQLAMFDISPHNLTRAWRRAAIHAADANISDLGTCLWPGYKWLQNLKYHD